MKIKNKTNNVGAGPVSAKKGISTRHKPFVRIGNATTGITLIALVITIIILLILAGITINLTIGEHGILNMAKEAGEEYQKAAARDKLELAISNLQATKLGDMKLVDLNDIEDTSIKVLDIILEDDVEAYIEVDGKYQFAVDFDFNICYIENGNKDIEYIEGLFKMPVLTSDDCVIDGKRYIVTASSVLNSSHHPYSIFLEAEIDDYWHSDGGDDQWVQVQFPDKIKINKFTIKNRDQSTSYAPSGIELQVSNDGKNWTTLGNYDNNTDRAAQTSFNLENADYYYYYKFNCGDGAKAIRKLILDEATIKISRKTILQIQNSINQIGDITRGIYKELINIYKEYNSLTDEAKTLITNYKKLENAINSYNSMFKFEMPALTSNDCIIDGKRYIATASGEDNDNELAYKAFNGVAGKDWWSVQGNSEQWIQIQLPEKIKINSFTVKNRDYNSSYAPSEIELQGSNDGENWTTLGNYNNNTDRAAQTKFNVEDSDFYYYYRFNCGKGTVAISEITIDEAIM